MREIVARFCRVRDRIALRHCAPPEHRELREDVPHSVRALGAEPDFGERARIDLLMGGNEMLQTVVLANSSSATSLDVVPLTCPSCRTPRDNQLRPPPVN